MKIASFLRSASFAFILAIAFGLPAARAGQPLICHPYAIGDAACLPGSDHGPKGTDPNYDRTRLTADTLVLLTPNQPILARMETLRRAAIYATADLRGWAKGSHYTGEDQRIARELAAALEQRVQAATDDDRALALFDAGFFAETLRQTGLDPALDGYRRLLAATELRRGDPEIEFALALATAYPRRPEHAGHVARARLGAAKKPLLAANLGLFFGGS